VIALIFSLLLGLALIALLIVLARRNSTAEGSAPALLEARLALQTLQDGLLPAELLERIFSRQDFAYIVSAAPKEVQELFLQERRKVALVWVSRVRRQILSLWHFHLSRSRFEPQMNLAAELGLAIQFTTLLLECRGLQFVLYVGGPYAAPQLVGATAEAAARVCSISEKALAFLSPSGMNGLADDPPSTGTILK
jgi:hypothetical protein